MSGFLPRLSQGPVCLAAAEGAPSGGGCEGAAALQNWQIRQIRLGARCLRAHGQGLEWGPCEGLDTRFGWMSNGQIRAAAGLCLSMEEERWALRPCAPPELWAAGAFAWDAEPWSSQSRWGSFALHDVSGDGRADACARFADGVRCAISDGTSFAAPSLWLQGEFDDASGWERAAHGATLRFGDIDGDGYADVCGRGVLGVFCALGDGTTFERPRFWGYHSSLSVSEGWPAREQFWASLALVDVNADGRDDLCIRAPEGVRCAWSTGTTFARPHALGGFADAEGFGTETHGGSLRWARVDGDGLMDVCARGPSGVQCALTSP